MWLWNLSNTNCFEKNCLIILETDVFHPDCNGLTLSIPHSPFFHTLPHYLLLPRDTEKKRLSLPPHCPLSTVSSSPLLPLWPVQERERAAWRVCCLVTLAHSYRELSARYGAWFPISFHHFHLLSPSISLFSPNDHYPYWKTVHFTIVRFLYLALANCHSLTVILIWTLRFLIISKFPIQLLYFGTNLASRVLV